MPRGVYKRKAAESPTKSATKAQSNPVPKCCEDWDQFSGPNLEDILASLDDESGEDSDNSVHNEPVKLPTIPHHSLELFHCCNLTAHKDRRHYVCRICATLASAYLRDTPNALLNSGNPSTLQGQRFFPLCEVCTREAIASANQGCVCDCLDQALCFECKRDMLESAAARRDAEINHRLGFVPLGKEGRDKLFLKPVLRCICGIEEVGGDGEEGIFRCAGCRGTVIKTGGRVWDPLIGDYVVVGLNR
ncbi:hypothetical protein MMC31_007482 [Peltigera leucophlebia]|nr:hypothetical protein [Peltigera leucophlebia]